MKTNNPVVKKYLILSLLVVYFFTALTYTVFLPKYNTFINNPEPNIHLTLNPAHLNNNYGSNNSQITFHCIFKSLAENKRNNAIILLLITAFTLLFLNGVTLKGLLKNPDKHLKLFFLPTRYSYLNFCSLKI